MEESNDKNNEHNNKYSPKYCKELTDHLGQGFSLDSFFPSDVSVTTRTIYNWIEAHPEFKEAQEMGLLKGLKYYEQLLQYEATGIVPPQMQKLRGKNRANVAAVIFVLKTRFYKIYGDRAKLDLGDSNGEPISFSVNIVRPKEIDKPDEAPKP